MEVYTDRGIRMLFTLLISCVIVVDFTCGTGIYEDNGIDRTEKVAELSGRNRRELQHEILTLLGLHHRPKPTTHKTTLYSAPRYMINLYNTISTADGEIGENGRVFRTNESIAVDNDVIEPVNGTDVIMSFINQANKVRHLRRQKDRTFYFEFGEVTPRESAIRTELRLYKEQAGKWKHHPFSVQIYSIRQGNDPEEFEIVSEVNQTVPANHEGWLSFNLTRVANSWISNPVANMGLYLKVHYLRKDKDVKPVKFGIVGRRGPEEKQPFMVGFFTSTQQLHTRKTRSVERRRAREYSNSNNDEGYRYNNIYRRQMRRPCQRKTLYMRFRDLGWQNWIIAPDGYKAFYCEGECAFPLGAHMNATNHAIIQSLVHLWKPSEIPWPGCAPTKLGSQSVLYFDDESNVVLRKFPDMIVKSCGCH